MLREGKALLVAAAIALALAVSAAGMAGAEDGRLSGVIIGRTGEVLHISVPQPLAEGTVMAVKPLEIEDPIAEARVLSCTKERPFLVLAKVVRGGIGTPVPIGVRAYADEEAVAGPDVPKPLKRSQGDNDRFSLQAGAFRPSTPALQDTVDDYWQAYRLNYSFLKAKGFEALLSAEYTKGSGDFVSETGPVKRTMEIIPVTMLGRIKPVRMGSAHFFIGAGGGIYRIRSREKVGTTLTASSTDEFGYEFAAGLESKRGWTVELRYRDVKDADIKGYSLAIGSRF